MFDNEPLTKEQKQALLERMQSLQECVQKYKISSEELDEDQAEELAESQPKHIFSIQLDMHAVPASSAIQALESPLIPGFDRQSDTYFECEIPWVSESDLELWPYTELFFECSACMDSDSPGLDCDECDDGQFIYELLWDDRGVVTFERSL